MNKLKEIAERWNWDNLDDKWTILQGAYCRLSWVVDALCNDNSMIDDEYKNIINDTLELIEALQDRVKDKLTDEPVKNTRGNETLHPLFKDIFKPYLKGE